jgi:hypothetical protein
MRYQLIVLNKDAYLHLQLDSWVELTCISSITLTLNTPIINVSTIFQCSSESCRLGVAVRGTPLLDHHNHIHLLRTRNS